MAMSFGSGKETFKYDNKVPEEVFVELNHTHNCLIDINSELTKKLNELQHSFNEANNINDFKHNETISRITAMSHDLNQIENYINSYNTNIEIMSAFMRSKLFKFLNFFGRWYFIDVNRIRHLNMLDNRKLYAKYKSPFRYKFEAKLRAIKKFFKSIKK